MDTTLYDLLAGLFVHPGPGFVANLDRARTRLAERHAEALAALETFRSGLPLGDLHALQELHARTFDVQAITTLDVGYVLFGEDYKRGELLAHLSREHRAAGIDCAGELADHLSNLLRLLPRLADAELRAELVTILLDPALKRMVAEFEPERLAEKDRMYRKHHRTVIEVSPELRDLYRGALLALREVLRVDFALDQARLDEPASEFVKAVGAEMTIEGDHSCPPCS